MFTFLSRLKAGKPETTFASGHGAYHGNGRSGDGRATEPSKIIIVTSGTRNNPHDATLESINPLRAGAGLLTVHITDTDGRATVGRRIHAKVMIVTSGTRDKLYDATLESINRLRAVAGLLTRNDNVRLQRHGMRAKVLNKLPTGNELKDVHVDLVIVVDGQAGYTYGASHNVALDMHSETK